ncbi:MAG: HAMP domain-containing protein [Solirubrobacterales bacterium]|nr:HAMP domain-containing protein [Solirubrobacterales bacterium]
MRTRLRRSLGSQLLLAQLLVVLAGAGTLLITALSLGPAFFRHHVREALGTVPPDVARHLDDAFDQSVLLSLGIATGAAVLTALAVSWLVARRIVSPIRELAASADRIAHGAYADRVAVTGDDEVAQLGRSFNAMATSLDSAERRRRRLLSDVAHELRTPLATVDAHLEGMADGVLPADAETLATARRETARIARLVDDLQRVSRAEEGRLDLEVRPVPPADLVTAAARAARPAFEAKGVALQVTTAGGDLPAVAVDPQRLVEVLTNLLDNALRHTPPGGEVRVRAALRGGRVELAVADTGEGIAAEDLDRVFERFFRTDPARSRATGGSGIGLAIARALVEAHGGRIRAHSDGPGRGATFTVELPAANAVANP